MKLSFSTLGCPDFTWQDILALAKDFGFHGIEMRGLGDNIFAVNSPFKKENLAKTKEQLKKLRLEICCLSSGCALRYGERRDENIAELRRYIETAEALGTPYIRVLGDLTAEPTDDFDDEIVIDQLRKLAPYAEAAGVMLLVETNGVYSDTARLSDVLARVASDSVAALWDFNHPYRFAGETPEKT
ncbi:MAG: sugar phosphate isomerase/epimerase, partial [Clostridia bacterium]|nr:sugar phosphate isomerase/epimerase [Clostridia bacterium]